MHNIVITFITCLAALLSTLARSMRAHVDGKAVQDQAQPQLPDLPAEQPNEPLNADPQQLTNPVTGEIWTPGKKGPRPAWVKQALSAAVPVDSGRAIAAESETMPDAPPRIIESAALGNVTPIRPAAAALSDADAIAAVIAAVQANPDVSRAVRLELNGRPLGSVGAQLVRDLLELATDHAALKRAAAEIEAVRDLLNSSAAKNPNILTSVRTAIADIGCASYQDVVEKGRVRYLKSKLDEFAAAYDKPPIAAPTDFNI